MAGAEGHGGGGRGYLYWDPSLSPPSSVTTLSPKLSRLQWRGDPCCEGTSPPQALCGGGALCPSSAATFTARSHIRHWFGGH